MNMKSPSQCCLNKITLRQFLFLTGYFFDNNRLLQILHQHCTNFPDIAQEKSWANIEQKDKTLRNSVTSLLFMVMNDNTGESQIEMQIRKNVNKYTNIIIISTICCSLWFPISCYLKEKVIFVLTRYIQKLKLKYLKESYLL